jgi:hypothetical protein
MNKHIQARGRRKVTQLMEVKANAVCIAGKKVIQLEIFGVSLGKVLQQKEPQRGQQLNKLDYIKINSE